MPVCLCERTYCMCTCVSVCLWARMRACVHVYMCVCASVCLCTDMCACVPVYMCICVSVHVEAHEQQWQLTGTPAELWLVGRSPVHPGDGEDGADGVGLLDLVVLQLKYLKGKYRQQQTAGNNTAMTNTAMTNTAMTNVCLYDKHTPDKETMTHTSMILIYTTNYNQCKFQGIDWGCRSHDAAWCHMTVMWPHLQVLIPPTSGKAVFPLKVPLTVIDRTTVGCKSVRRIVSLALVPQLQTDIPRSDSHMITQWSHDSHMLIT